MTININVPGGLQNDLTFNVALDAAVTNGCCESRCNYENGELKVGDIVPFVLSGGEEAEAMAVRKESDGMLFILVDCLKDEYQMNTSSTNKGGYAECDLRGDLNGKILNRFPSEIKDRMVAFENGDLLRLPTEKEIFGENPYGENEPTDIQQFEPMKRRRNRMAFQGKESDFEWYWLQNKMKNSATDFALVDGSGLANYYHASTSLGVRPCFKLKI